MDVLFEKVKNILEGSDFNDLPIEERERIGKYIDEQKIRTIYQVLNAGKEDTTERWRRKIRGWLKNCVDSYHRDYGGE